MKPLVSIDQVREYWDRRPCNIRHSDKPVGTHEYFDEVERRKYFVEPHIPGFAEFGAWAGKYVLEVGCGIGTDTINFLRAGAWVTAVDCSREATAITTQRAGLLHQYSKLTCITMDVDQRLPKGRYDLVYAFGVLHHTPNPDQALDNMRRVIAPTGTLKLMLYHRRSWKVLSLLISGFRFWKLDKLIARRSEAQPDCPIARAYTRNQARELVERHGFRITDIRAAHIFPYQVKDYVEYRYVKEWWWRWMPKRVFEWLESKIGWHLLVTARPI